VAPVFSADDPQATVLGRLADGRAGLVRREMGGWTSVYSAAPKLPTALLRQWAAAADVHLYLRDPRPHDVIYANRSVLALCASEAGSRTVNLPRDCDVFDLLDGGRPVAQSARQFTVTPTANQTKLFHLANPGGKP